MRTIHVKCPRCKSEYDVAAEKESVFCMECGTTITVMEQSKKEYTYSHNENINKNINIDNKRTYRKVDDARIREAEAQESIRLRELEIELLKMQDEARQKKSSLRVKYGILLACLLVIVLLIVSIVLSNDEFIQFVCCFLTMGMIWFVVNIVSKLFKQK